MATCTSTTSPAPAVPLSSLFTDPDVRAAFWRAERDQGDGEAFLVPAEPRPPVLRGSAALEIVEA